MLRKARKAVNKERIYGLLCGLWRGLFLSAKGGNAVKGIIYAVWLCLLLVLSGCAAKVTAWNGKTEYYAQVCMTIDPTNLQEYVDAVDYVFVGTVQETIKNVISEKDDYSTYRIHVDKNKDI